MGQLANLGVDSVLSYSSMARFASQQYCAQAMAATRTVSKAYANAVQALSGLYGEPLVECAACDGMVVDSGIKQFHDGFQVLVS